MRFFFLITIEQKKANTPSRDAFMQMNERTINAQWCKEEKTDNDEDKRGAEVERRSVDFSME